MKGRKIMKILVLNCGSSSLKYQLIDMNTEDVIASGRYERIGEEEAFITHKVNGQKIEIKNAVYNHSEAIDFALKQLINPKYKVIDSLDEINAVGHRLVHGGEKIAESAIIDENVVEVLKEYTDLAPLHNPACILGIEACKEVMPNKPMVGVFDTAFHQTMPKDKYIYPIPYEYYKKYSVRKYGFHGTSHMFVSQKLAEIENKPIEDMRIVTCHLGQGSSICAIKGGKSIDTSMGLTPLGGLPMVTRSGDLDPSVVTYIMKKENLTPTQMEDILNKKSGISGMSNLEPDFRTIENKSNNNDEAKLAIENFNYVIASYVAKYAVAMNGIDYIVFTGGIGENQINIRKGVCEKLAFMGVDINAEANNIKGEEKVISSPDSKVKVYVIPTNEELMIAKETLRLIK